MLQDIYVKAADFAAKAHRGQSIPGSETPYILHCAKVCMEIFFVISRRSDLNSELCINCALLHDVLEDTDVIYEDIYKEFGKDTAEAVLALTKDKDIEKKLRMEDSLRRIKSSGPETGIVKMADRISNLAPPPELWDREKIIHYYHESEMIYEALKSLDHHLAGRLFEKINNYRKYWQ
jgi:(p)ppGpp synthase/HD superfamily hydrolase